MTTRKRPQLGALFGGTADAPAAERATTRLRSVDGAVDGTAETVGEPTGEGGAARRPAARTAPRILLDAVTPGAGSTAGQPLPWSPGGWLDPVVIAGQYFDFWQAVLDSSRRLVVGATAAATGRSVPDRD